MHARLGLKPLAFTALALTGLVSVPAPAPAAEDSAFAIPPIGSNDRLGDLMTLLQNRHIKLWYAGSVCNWKLVSYEKRRLWDTAVKAAVIYEGIPVPYVTALTDQLSAVEAAATAQDRKAFSTAYAGLTHACNNCHVAAGVDYLNIQTPTHSPFTDQSFGGGCKK